MKARDRWYFYNFSAGVCLIGLMRTFGWGTAVVCRGKKQKVIKSPSKSKAHSLCWREGSWIAALGPRHRFPKQNPPKVTFFSFSNHSNTAHVFRIISFRIADLAIRNLRPTPLCWFCWPHPTRFRSNRPITDVSATRTQPVLSASENLDAKQQRIEATRCNRHARPSQHTIGRRLSCQATSKM